MQREEEGEEGVEGEKKEKKELIRAREETARLNRVILMMKGAAAAGSHPSVCTHAVFPAAITSLAVRT